MCPFAARIPSSAVLLLALLGVAMPLAAQAPSSRTPGLTLGTPAAAATGGGDLPAPVGVVTQPEIAYFLFPLAGDRAHLRYAPGSLDRAANLQTRLELSARQLEKWLDEPVNLRAHVLDRDHWQRARIDVPYGVPRRFDDGGILAPARGDETSVDLWRQLMGGPLPTVRGRPLIGTPQAAAVVAIADILVQVQVGQILVDALGYTSDAPWVNGVAAHTIALGLSQKLEGTGRLAGLDAFWDRLGARHAPRTWSDRDERGALSLPDWLWFQAQYHRGARALLAAENDRGKRAVKRLRRVRMSDGGPLSAERMRLEYPALDDWHRATFTAVSVRNPGRATAPETP
ncbi:MAG: hypothetical protein AAF772_07725 [Acidobacteriota bacterium]